MRIKNSTTNYGIVAIIIHWVMALIIIGMLALGLYMTSLKNSLFKLQLYGWHKEIGVLVLMLVIVRLTWRLINSSPSLASLPWLQRLAAQVVHWAFYVFMFALPITGWLITSAAGLQVSFFGLFLLPNLVSPDKVQMHLYENIHSWLAWGLIATICCHVFAALVHHFINKDDILLRILR